MVSYPSPSPPPSKFQPDKGEVLLSIRFMGVVPRSVSENPGEITRPLPPSFGGISGAPSSVARSLVQPPTSTVSVLGSSTLDAENLATETTALLGSQTDVLPREVNCLSIKLLRGRGLKAMDRNGKSDPVATVRCGPRTRM